MREFVLSVSRDTQSVFSRRKVASDRVFKKPLFKFEGSRHAISISSYMREQRDLELTGGVAGPMSSVVTHTFEQDQPSIAQHLVCKPHHRNVTGEEGSQGGGQGQSEGGCGFPLLLQLSFVW